MAHRCHRVPFSFEPSWKHPPDLIAEFLITGFDLRCLIEMKGRRDTNRMPEGGGHVA